ncbi:MAG: glycosyltransferase family 2 protein [Candidatus Sungbacteria bacterium]|uniref:Glycosyltransferase family 2 protein n=1 Tax=Candidatus Sungiibacteriota bacterium TaxID=2750080 RepID=A0A9D6QUD3_9BACT|nr:glycosyltransferase family 2 protein [Candidatus Sungbacteria bacterium]
MSPKISFVIPAYNEEHYISECLRSVLVELQSVDVKVEVIVVNNASRDRTGEIARSFHGVRVVDEPGKGLARARQAGFTASLGELIANIDADTILRPGWIEMALKEFEHDRRLVALSGPYIYHDLSLWHNIFVRFFYWLGYILYLLNRFVFRVGSMIQGGNFIVCREALTKIGGFDPRFYFYGEDTDLARRLHKVGKVKFNMRFSIYSSGRRLAHEGVLTMGARYALNYLWTMFLRRPFTQSYKDIR